MIKYFIVFLFIGVSCQQNREVPVPDTRWDLFDSPKAIALTEGTRKKIEGVYSLGDKDNAFGELAVFKWSYAFDGRDTINGKDTTFYLSIFCEKDKAYFVCKGKRLDSIILLNGYWRKMETDETGKAHFMIQPEMAKNILDSATAEGVNVMIEGSYGEDEDEPGTRLTFKWLRKLSKKKDFEIVGHRGGGRITDFIPASENSVELIRLASRCGATGVEIDIQLTKDGIPILYHDANINNRLTHKPGVHGSIDEYTYAELHEKITLKKGEKIPTLREALETIVYQTPLEFVWLDVKEKTALQKTVALQQEFTQAALAGGRKIQLTIGIHDEKVYEEFLRLPGHENIPSLCELSPEETASINARIWAPMWTEGLQKEEVALVHSQGRRAFVWTVDKQKQIHEFITEGGFDGMVSNFPSLVAFYFYTAQ